MGKPRKRHAWLGALAVLVAACALSGCVAPGWPENPSPGPSFQFLDPPDAWPFLTDVGDGVMAHTLLREIRDGAFDAMRAEPAPTGQDREDILWAIKRSFECYGPDWLADAKRTVLAGRVTDAHALLASTPVDWRAVGNELQPEFAAAPGGTKERWPWVVALAPGKPAANDLRKIRDLAFDALRADPPEDEREHILRAILNAFECFGRDWYSTDPVEETSHAIRIYTALVYAEIPEIGWQIVADELDPPH